jgi:anti-sigma B factor antagonist
VTGLPPLSVVHTAAFALVRLAGDVDLAAADEIEAEILQRTTGAPGVVLDLSAVGFLDSAGLRLLDRVVGECDDRGVGVRVVVPEASPARLPVVVCGFREGLVHGSVAEAIAELPRAGQADPPD